MSNLTFTLPFHFVSSASVLGIQDALNLPSFADAFGPASVVSDNGISRDWPVVTVWDDYCQSNDSIHYDCFSWCGNGGAFRSMFHLQNCLIFLRMSTPAYSSPSPSPYNNTNPQNISVVDENLHSVGKYVSNEDTPALFDQTATLIWDCLMAKCRMLVSCPFTWDPQLSGPDNVLRITETQLYDFCSLLPAVLDPDLAGIGVS